MKRLEFGSRNGMAASRCVISQAQIEWAQPSRCMGNKNLWSAPIPLLAMQGHAIQRRGATGEDGNGFCKRCQAACFESFSPGPPKWHANNCEMDRDRRPDCLIIRTMTVSVCKQLG